MTKEKIKNKFDLTIRFTFDSFNNSLFTDDNFEIDGAAFSIFYYNYQDVCQVRFSIWNKSSEEITPNVFREAEKILSDIILNRTLHAWKPSGSATTDVGLRCSFSKKVSIGDEVINSSKSLTLNLLKESPIDSIKVVEEFYNKEKS